MSELLVQKTPATHIVAAARAFVLETLPAVQEYFTADHANVFDYYGSAQGFWMTGLDRVANAITNSIHDAEFPKFGVMTKAAWNDMRFMVTDLIAKSDPVLAIQLRQYRDPMDRAFWWDGVPFFWDQTLTDLGQNTIYIVNPDSFKLPPSKERRLNGLILNTDRS